MARWQPEIAEVLGRLPFASNATLLARSGDDELVVYKPERGEQPLWDFPYGTLAGREALAWEVSRALGFAIVPQTALTDGPLGRGSVQRFIDEDLDFDPRPLLRGPQPRLWPFAVLDIVCNNADRKLGHLIAEQGSGRLWAIDNALTFHHLPKLRTVLWGFAGCELPAKMREAVERLATTLEDGLAPRLAELLSAREVAALRARVEGLLADPVHPLPPTDRPALPWPVY